MTDAAPPFPEVAAGRRGPPVLVVLALLLATVALARLPTHGEPLERDLATYAVIARELLAGRTLYDDLWDHKPPGVHLVYAAAEAVAGAGPGAVYLLAVLSAAATLVGIYFAAASAGRGPATGLWAAACYTAVSGDLALQANQPNVESFLNPCLVWAFAALLGAGRGRRTGHLAVLLAATLLALATLLKTNVAAAIPVFALAHVARPPGAPSGRRRAVADAGWMVAVTTALWLAVLGSFAASGRLGDFVAAVFTYNRAYAGSVPWNLLRGGMPERLLPTSLATLLPLVAVAVLGLAGWLARAGRTAATRPAALTAAYAAAVYLAVAAPGRFYPHYYQLWLPLLAIGAAWALEAWPRPAAPRVALLALLVLLQAPAFRLDAAGWSRAKYGGAFVETALAGQAIDRLLRPDETFWQWGAEPGLYWTSRRRPPSGILYAMPLLEGPLRDRLTAQALAALERQPPELLVMARSTERPDGHPLVEWISRRYRPVPGLAATAGFDLFCRRGGELCRRAGADPARAAAPGDADRSQIPGSIDFHPGTD